MTIEKELAKEFVAHWTKKIKQRYLLIGFTIGLLFGLCVTLFVKR